MVRSHQNLTLQLGTKQHHGFCAEFFPDDPPHPRTMLTNTSRGSPFLEGETNICVQHCMGVRGIIYFFGCYRQKNVWFEKHAAKNGAFSGCMVSCFFMFCSFGRHEFCVHGAFLVFLNLQVGNRTVGPHSTGVRGIVLKELTINPMIFVLSHIVGKVKTFSGVSVNVLCYFKRGNYQ